MIGKAERLAPKSHEIVAKVIDEEAIIINLANGFYYSSVGVGSFVWSGIEAARTAEEISAAVAAVFVQPAAIVDADLNRFLAELQEEGLIGPAADGLPTIQWDHASVPGAAAYAAPALARFEDMAHFFALDPPLPTLDEAESGAANAS